MPIRVQCACGAAFAAKDELAGRTVKCPKCQQPLPIPAGGAPVAAAAGQHPAQAPRPASAPLPSQAPSALYDTAPRAAGPSDSMYDDVGLRTQQAGTLPCPGCANPMPMNAVVCIKCGYNKKLGRRMEVVKQTGGTELPGGHSVTVEEMLGKAAERLEEDKEEERKKTKEGMPWWLYLIGLTAVMGFMIAMMLIPQNMAMRVGGFSIMAIAWLAAMYSGIRLIIIAFQESTTQGLLYLLVPFYSLIYIFSRWDRCGGLFLMNCAAGFVWGMGYGAVFFADTLGQPAEDSRYVPHSDRQTAICRVIAGSPEPWFADDSQSNS